MVVAIHFVQVKYTIKLSF